MPRIHSLGGHALARRTRREEPCVYAAKSCPHADAVLEDRHRTSCGRFGSLKPEKFSSAADEHRWTGKGKSLSGPAGQNTVWPWRNKSGVLALVVHQNALCIKPVAADFGFQPSFLLALKGSRWTGAFVGRRFGGGGRAFKI